MIQSVPHDSPVLVLIGSENASLSKWEHAVAFLRLEPHVALLKSLV